MVLIGGLLLLAMGVLGDLCRSIRRQISRRFPEKSHFWILNFLDPAYRLLQVLLALAAGWVLLRIYGWDSTTPGIRELLAFGRVPMLTLGASVLSIWDVCSTLLLIGLAFWVGGWSQQVSYNLALTRVRDLGIRQSLSTFIQYVVVVLGLVLTLKLIGLDLTALTVFAASIGVGIGFGLQNIVNNFISGVLLLAERPLRVSDTVTIGGETGQVSRIGIRSLVVRTFDRKELIIPNSAVIGNTFTNWTRTDDTVREVLLFRISYRDDPSLAAELVRQVARSTNGVLANPAPQATVYEFGEAAVTIRLQYYVRLHGPVGGLDVRAEILTRVRDAFAEAGFVVPTPLGEITLPRSEPRPALATPG
jgi:potassium efflux system protein